MATTEGAAPVVLPAAAAPEDLDWRGSALCAEVDPELWFPRKGEPSAPAKLLCGRCDVRAECLEYALEMNEQFGVWGGLSTKERMTLRRRQRLRHALRRAGASLPYELDKPGCGLATQGGEAA